MNTRSSAIFRIRTLCACLLMVLARGVSGQGAEAKARVEPGRPNVVLILLDNVGREWFGSYGSEEGCTPQMDRLAGEGVRFLNCYTTVVCGPSRVELLTGRYPHRTGWHLHHDAALYSGGGLDPKREVTVARVLRDRGYATGIAGKWQVNNLYDEPGVLAAHGFQEQLVWPGSIDRDKVDDDFRKAFQAAIARNDADYLAPANRNIESRYWDPVVLRDGKRERLEGRFGPDVFAEYAEEFVKRHRSGPFFLYYPMVLTHGQNFVEHTVLTPKNRAAPPKEEKDRFADMLRYADEQVGAFVAMLEREGLRENTIVIVASDNGTEETLSARANGRVVKGGLYKINEAGGNVALMVSCPTRIPGGRTAALADFTDILPTICDLTGSAKPQSVMLDGQSFADFLLGRGEAPRKWIFNEYGSDRVVRDGRYKLNQRGELYDLKGDPDEQHVLATLDDEASAAKARLQKVLDGMPAVTPLPFEHRSLSAFKKRAQAAAAAKERKVEGWRALPLVTDGKVDKAWAQVGYGGFVVDEGALRTEPDDRGMGLLLYQAEKFGDCQLRVVYRCEKPKSNSGIYVRMDDGVLGRVGEKSLEVHRDANGKLSKEMIQRLEESSEKHLGAWYPVHHGYEVQIMDDADAAHRTGAIYSLAAAAALPAKAAGEWRTMIITLHGERIIVDVDGATVSNFLATSPNNPPRQKWTEPIREIKRPTHGYIGLQNHDPGDIVWFKEVSVKPLEGASAGAPVSDAARFVTMWGREGEAPGEFNIPIGVAINARDEVFVTDHYNSRVQKFDGDGKLLASFAVLPNPGGIAWDGGRIYLGHFPASRMRKDKAPDRMSVYTEEGQFIREWGGTGKGDGQFDFPGGVVLNKRGEVFVADQTNRRVQVFDREGNFLRKWGEYGEKPGQFGGNTSVKSRVGGPNFMVVDGEGNLFTTEASMMRVQKFSPQGEPLLAWGDKADAPGGLGGLFTAFKANLVGPIGICLDRKERLWIAAVSGRVQCFTREGKYVGGIGATQGIGPGQFYAPHGVAVNSRNELFVVDTYNHRVQKFEIRL